MVPDHGTQYEENPSSHHWGMYKGGQTDWRTGPVPIFPDFCYCGMGNNKSTQLQIRMAVTTSIIGKSNKLTRIFTDDEYFPFVGSMYLLYIYIYVSFLVM